MKIIQKQHAMLSAFFKPVAYISGEELRPLKYLYTTAVPEGLLVFNVLGRDLILLEDKETELLKTAVMPDAPGETLHFLLDHRFLVRADFDERAVCLDLRAAIRNMEALFTKHLQIATILTTTDCNARCWYCYEADTKKQTMDSETAGATADYLQKYGDPKDMSLVWFGGEPLMNPSAIDIITSRMRDEGRTFTSKILTNGYLFDPEIVKRAKNDWNVASVQIPIDGTEQAYNRCKRFIGADPDESPFERVLGNIGLLLDAGIETAVRMNVSAANEPEMVSLVGILKKRFAGRDGFAAYVSELHDIPHRLENSRSSSYFEQEEKALQHVRQQIIDAGIKTERRRSSLSSLPSIHYCDSISLFAAAIMPDGTLQSCWEFMHYPAWGNVRDFPQKTEKDIKRWAEEYPELPECSDCPRFPDCLRPRCCLFTKPQCSGLFRNSCKQEYIEKMIGAYQSTML